MAAGLAMISLANMKAISPMYTFLNKVLIAWIAMMRISTGMGKQISLPATI